MAIFIFIAFLLSKFLNLKQNTKKSGRPTFRDDVSLDEKRASPQLRKFLSIKSKYNKSSLN